MIININDMVKVRLTEEGLRIHKQLHEDWVKTLPKEARQLVPYRKPVPDQEGWYEFQLWSLMNDFGPYFYMGNMKLPFKDNNIKVS